MKSFRYLRDGLFLVSCALYAFNRWMVLPHVQSPFLHGHFNDLLLIPCALPPLLLIQRWLKLRTHDEMPGTGEIALYCGVWSVMFEGIGPRIVSWTTGDVWDVAAYVLGAVFAGVWWNRDCLSDRESERVGACDRLHAS